MIGVTESTAAVGFAATFIRSTGTSTAATSTGSGSAATIAAFFGCGETPTAGSF